MEDINNPIVLQRADPFVLRHEGQYYFTGSYPLYDRIILRISNSLNGLKEAKEYTVWLKDSKGPKSELIWAPELHRVNDKWYIYYAAAPDTNIDDDTFNHRMYVLENESDNILEGEWVDKGQIDTGWETFALDATVFTLNNELYYVWSQQDLNIKGHSNIYISKMKNPWTLEGKITLLTVPEFEWEIKGFWVNEGPAILIKDEKIFLTYSASATGIDYCVGMLSADINSDLLNADSWTKNDEPVFESSIENKQYGPGHNSFTKSEDGKHDIIVYHARNYQDIKGDPLFDPNRHARAQIISWDENNNPQFGIPLPDNRWTPETPEILGGEVHE